MTSLQTLLVGPAVSSFGGTQSVIELIHTYSLGADNVEVAATWAGPNHVRNAHLLMSTARRILELPPRTVVHFHISNGGAWVREGILLWLARRRGLPTVVSLHGYEVADFARAHPKSVGAVLRHAHYVTCLSEATQSIVQHLVPGVPVSVLANPVVIDTHAPSAGDTEPVVLFAGEIGTRKGVDILTAAWARLVDTGVQGRCRLVGPIADFEPPRLERLTVEPAVARAEIPHLLRTARVVVLPSRAEGMPMILTEALAGARPIVATPVGGVRLIAPQGAMLVPVGDVGALTEAMSTYLRDPERASVDGLLGQRHIARTRSPAVIGRELRAIYEGLL